MLSQSTVFCSQARPSTKKMIHPCKTLHHFWNETQLSSKGASSREEGLLDNILV